MSQFNSKAFQLSILAAAMLSLSACSSIPVIGGVDLRPVGNGLSKVGSKTVELSSSAWEGTKNILNIRPQGQDSDLLDEVDLALMDDNANPAVVQVASNDIDNLLPQGNLDATLTDAPNQVDAFGVVPASGELVTLEEINQLETELMAADDALVADTALLGEETVASNDMTHVVSEGENLWAIAKTTTGDANNWHVLADINNLAPNASVFVGQKLTIPGDMAKPVEAPVLAAATPEAADPALKLESQAAVALKIPESSTDDAAVVATAEQLNPAADAADMMTNATALKVGPGETLWDFSKRTTGDATNWKTIAAKNLFDKRQISIIRPGQKIYVPTELVRSRDADGVLLAEGTVLDAEAIDATAAVLAGTNEPNGAVKIVEAAYKDDGGTAPVTAESLSQEAALAVADNDDVGNVMVSGTYYPKAVYNDADFSSSLLMRVSPGTKLKVSKAIGPWLEVQTHMGVGYVHSRDIK